MSLSYVGEVFLPHELCSPTAPSSGLSAHPREGNIGLSENFDKEPPVLVTMGLDVPGFGWGGRPLEVQGPRVQPQVRLLRRGEDSRSLSAVAAERVDFGDPTGMAGSVPGELELPA